MLLLVTLGLVVASAVLLVLGFVRDALGFIYLSMLCAGVAALALFVFARLTRRRSAALAGAGIAGGVPTPYAAGGGRDEPGPPSRDSRRGERTRNLDETGTGAAPDADPQLSPEPEADRWALEDDLWSEEGRPVPAGALDGPAPVAEAGLDPWADDEETGDDWGDEVVFPIEGYDSLRVAEILPLLGQLDAEELREVRDRELAGKARATILDRIDDRLGRTAGFPSASGQPTMPIPVVHPMEVGEPARRKTAAKKTPAKRTAAKKTAAAVQDEVTAPVPVLPEEPPAARKGTARRKVAAAESAPTTSAPRRTAAKKAAGSAGSSATRKAAGRTAKSAPAPEAAGPLADPTRDIPPAQDLPAGPGAAEPQE